MTMNPRPPFDPSIKMPALLAPDGVIVALIQARFAQVFAIYAFGSQVSGAATSDSDLDLAVLVPGYATPNVLWDVSSELSGLVHCPVDLLDLRAASTVMQYQIITTGRALYSSGLQAGLFESFVLSEKTELDAARAGLLRDIRVDGHIYAR